MSQWYCKLGGAPAGPFSRDELDYLFDRGQLTGDTEMRLENERSWSRAAELLEDLFPSAPVAAAAVVESPQPVAEAPAAQPAMPQQPRPVTKEETEAQRRRKQVLLGTGIGAGAALLIFLLLLLLLTFGGFGKGTGYAGAGGQGTGDGTGTGSGTGPGSGSGTGGGAGSGTGGSAGSSKASSSDAKAGPAGGANKSGEGAGGASQATAEAGDAKGAASGDAEDPDLRTRPQFAIQKFNTPAPAAGGAAAGSGDGSFLSGGGGGGGSDGREFLGVKVRGKIALVCDTSGSMAGDFPILVRELREKFPKDTPLILVGGCYFPPANPGAPPPQKLSGQMPYMGNEFANDPHTYVATSTTDAIIFAVQELKRNTVMFNNDLQDGGSESAIDAFEALRKKKKFTLSGRSLNCEAPERLLEFIRSSGGDFKVDPLTRNISPARPWGP